jgi:S1-C subfamily serine protease
VVQSVVPGGAAAKAGLQQGDKIKTIDGKQVQSPTDLSSAVALKQPGDKVKIGIERNGLTQELTATLGTRPQKTP